MEIIKKIVFILVYVIFLGGGPSFSAHTNDAVIRNKVNTVIKDIKKQCNMDVVSSEIGYLDGWKRSSDGTIWGKHYFNINFYAPVKDSSSTCIDRIIYKFFYTEGTFTGTTYKGHAFTMGKKNRGTVGLINEQKFNSAPGKTYSWENFGSSFQKKIVPVYVNLNVDDVVISNITPGKKSLGPSAKIKIRVSGKLKSKIRRAKLYIVPELMDFEKNPRLDLNVINVQNIERAKIINNKGIFKVRVRPNRSFDFVLDIQSTDSFDTGRTAALFLNIFLNGNKNPPIMVPLRIKKGIPWYVFLITGILIIAVGVIFFFYWKGRGINYNKYAIVLKIISGPDSSKSFPLAVSSIIAGRLEPDAEGIAIDSEKASRKHAVFTKTEKGYSVSDSKSTNGTFVNGLRLQDGESYLLHDGDEVKIANVSLLYSMKRR